MDEVLRLGPFDRLLDLPGIDGPEDRFGNISAVDGAENPFTMGSSTSSENLAYGGNPFAGQNFWDIFAGGVNPSDASFGSNNSFTD